MQDLKVALLQFNQIWENKEANYDEIKSLLTQEKDFNLLLFPEMFHTGFTMNHECLAEEMEQSEGINFLKALSTQYQTAIYTTLIIKSNHKVYNRGVLVQEQKVDLYDKRKCFGLSGETEFYTSGTKEMIVTLLGWRLNLQICYDLRFPEVSRNKLGKDGSPLYDVIMYVANWPQKRINHWIKLLQARAIENQCYVVACNRIGTDGNGLEYNGKSLIIDANGEIIGHESSDGVGELVRATLSYKKLEVLRNKLPFLQDR
jgi:predicted amidohydrolase